MGAPKKEEVVEVKVKKELDPIEKLELMINKAFGANTFYNPKKVSPIYKLPRVSTGNIYLDMDLGGGYALNKIHLITGQYSSGKSYLTNKIIAEFTKKKQRVFIVDAEFTFDPAWAEACGVDMDYVQLVRKQVHEDVINIIELLIASGEFHAGILDSMAALLPKRLKEEDAEKAEMGRGAYLNNRMFKKVLSQQSDMELAKKVSTTFFVINQWRQKVNSMGNPEILPGGQGQFYYPSTWTDFWVAEAILDGKDQVVGNKLGYRIRKNKTSPPKRTGVVSMFVEDYKGMGAGDWDSIGAVIDVALLRGVLQRSGTWYTSPILKGKNLQFTKLWTEIYKNPDLEMELVNAISGTLPRHQFDYTPCKRKGVIDDVAEVDAGQDGGNTEAEESKAGE